MGLVGAAEPGPLPLPRQRTCRICGFVETEQFYQVGEKQFATGEVFLYFQCSACGCLQIADFPPDIARYYPGDYYSLDRGAAGGTRVRRWLRRMRARYALTGKGILGKAISSRYPYRFAGAREWLALAGITTESRILDVGCGRGELLSDLAATGYRHLTGIDPFVEGDIQYPGGPRVLKKTVQEVDGCFDLIMFHHSLEHIRDQQETLQAARRLLASGGHCLVRIPVSSSFAWEHYRENWVQLDAPRHFYLHSVHSMILLGESAGLRLCRVQFDSTEIQFTGSERYLLGLPLNGLGRRFSHLEITRFRRRAMELNAQERGDQAAFYFTAA